MHWTELIERKTRSRKQEARFMPDTTREVITRRTGRRGKMFNTKFGTYVDGLVGVGGDRPYDYGFGVRTMF
jgi:hypothetical protein